MWKFIKYCFHCLITCFLWAMGNNPKPEEANFRTIFVGVITAAVLISLFLLILKIYNWIAYRVK